MTRVIIEFPDSKSALAFLGWFSDGGGEQEFFESEDIHAVEEKRKRITEFDYTKAFGAWGYNSKKHGPDRTVVAK